jgi:hypothetical protein
MEETHRIQSHIGLIEPADILETIPRILVRLREENP